MRCLQYCAREPFQGQPTRWCLSSPPQTPATRDTSLVTPARSHQLGHSSSGTNPGNPRLFSLVPTMTLWSAAALSSFPAHPPLSPHHFPLSLSISHIRRNSLGCKCSSPAPLFNCRPDRLWKSCSPAGGSQQPKLQIRVIDEKLVTT